METHFILYEAVILEIKQENYSPWTVHHSYKWFCYFESEEFLFFFDLMSAVRCRVFLFDTMGSQTWGSERH